MFCVSNRDLEFSLWKSLRVSLKSVYKGVEYVSCV